MISTRRRRRPNADTPHKGARRDFQSGSAGRLGRFAVAAASLTMLLFAFVPADAHASEGEASFWAAVEGTNAGDASSEGPQFGFGTQLGIAFGISDFWTLNLGAEGAYHPPASPGDEELSSLFVQNLYGGFRYNVDIFVYVPYVKASAVAYTAAPPVDSDDDPGPGVGAKLTVGVDWRFDRHWSVGPMAELHLVEFQLDQFPSYSSVGFRLSHHFRL